MISRNEELERNQGKWVAMNRAFKNKKKYNRKDKKKELRSDLSSFFIYDYTSLSFEKSVSLSNIVAPLVNVGLSFMFSI
jgi:hypothetical protein